MKQLTTKDKGLFDSYNYIGGKDTSWWKYSATKIWCCMHGPAQFYIMNWP